MIVDRKDLSSWVLHFVHRRVPENNPAYNINEGEETPAFPYHEDPEVNSRFEFWESVDESHTLAPDDYAIQVLLKIIQDGHIRAGWSFRKDRPTIYGPRAACCLTEMPLYGLIDYAASRSNESVDTYAVGLLKSEFFAAGGRPVIYGLTGPHLEAKSAPLPFPPHYSWPRKLDPKCGVAGQEQYRYVAMNLDASRRIDWSHEREWRWADARDQCSCPGLPIWLRDEPIQFSQAIVIVQTPVEAKQILDQLKELFDAGSHNLDYAYNRELLSNTKVVALEQIVNKSRNNLLRLEDLPASSLALFERPKASAQLRAEVRRALIEARAAANAGAKTFVKTAPRTADGSVADVCGFAYVTIYDPQSELISALLDLDEVDVFGGVGYAIKDICNHPSQALSVAEAAAEAAIEILKKRFPAVDFGVRTQWD
jgi:hypothetical protein